MLILRCPSPTPAQPELEVLGFVMKQVTQLAWLTAMLTLTVTCTTSAPPPDDAMQQAPAFADEYRIGIGDNLRVDVWRNPDLSVAVPVRPDGKITVPVAGDVQVGNLTPEEVSERIELVLAEYIREPVVTVIVTGMGSNEYLSRVRITGAVGAPSSMPYRPGMTVLDVVLEAGGVTDFGNPKRAVLYRADGQRLDIRLDRILQSGDMSTNFPLRPGDIVTVPQRAF